MKKRMLSLLLAVVMVLGMLPMTVLADDACAHANVEAVYTDNTDGTHTVTYACKSCGEAVANIGDALSIDFMDFASKADEQTWWAGLYDPTADDGIKQYGYTGMTDDTTAAYNEMIAWQKENLCWSINSACQLREP